jgi:hypothetical protein
MNDPKSAKPPKIRTGIPIDEAMRTENGEPIVRPTPNVDEEHDPTDPSDHGPHVDRVGMAQPDSDAADDERVERGRD